MKITLLDLENFKGTSSTLELGPATLVVGDNTTGKTTVLASLQLALAGHIPSLGKSNQKLWQLAGNPDGVGKMRVGVRFDSGWTYDLIWTRNDKGTISQTGEPPARVRIPDMLCDPTTFFTMTNEEKVKAIFAACPGVDFGAADVVKEFGAITAANGKIRDEAVAELTAEAEHAFTGRTPQTACETLLAKIKGLAKESKDEGKAKCGMLLGIAIPNPPPKDPSDEINQLQATKSEKTQMVGRLSAIKEKAAQIRLRMGEDWDSKIAQKQAEIKEARENKALPPVPPEKPKEIEELNQLREALIQHQATADALVAPIKTAWKAVDSLATGTCPTCGTKTTPGKKKAATVLLKTLTTKRDHALSAVDKLEERLEELVDICTTYEERKSQYDDAMESYSSDPGVQLNADLQNLLKEREGWLRLRTDLEASEAEIAALPKLLIEIREIDEALRGWADKRRAFELCETNRAKRNLLEAEAVHWTVREEVFGKAQKAMTAFIATKTSAAFNDVLNSARLFTDDILNSPLEFKDGELGRRVSRMDLKAPVSGQFEKAGRVVPLDSWIPVATFSGMETMITYAAFSVALASAAPFKIVLMDEIGRMSRMPKLNVIRRMVKLVERGTIDQFVGADSRTDDWIGRENPEITGLNIIEL